MTKPANSPKKSKFNEGYELLSDCCYYPPTGGNYYEGGKEGLEGYISGRCSRCKEGTNFEWVKNED